MKTSFKEPWVYAISRLTTKTTIQSLSLSPNYEVSKFKKHLEIYFTVYTILQEKMDNFNAKATSLIHTL